MGAMERITIDVPAELAASLRQGVADGGYESEDQIVSELLREWTAMRSDGNRLREAVAKAAKGPWVPAEDSFDRVRARLRDRITAG